MVRRLPVLQSSSDEPERPPWHWVLIGSGFVITLWLPLAMAALWVGGLFSGVTGVWAAIVHSGPIVLSFLTACAAAGALVGRFGGGAKVREAVLANAIGSVIILGIAALSGGLNPTLAALALAVLWGCALVGGLLGGRWGVRRRNAPSGK